MRAAAFDMPPLIRILAENSRPTGAAADRLRAALDRVAVALGIVEGGDERH